MKSYGFAGLVAVAILSTPAAAQAAWRVTTEDRAVARAAVLPAAGDPVAVVRGSKVTVTWPASSLDAVRGYRVERTNRANGRTVDATGECAGLIEATRRVEDAVPDGRWRCSVAAVVGANWTSEPGVGKSVLVWTRPREIKPRPTPTLSPDPVPRAAPAPDGTASSGASSPPPQADKTPEPASMAPSASGVPVAGDDVLG